MDRLRTSVAAWRTAASACMVYPAQQPPESLLNPMAADRMKLCVHVGSQHAVDAYHCRLSTHGAQKKPHQGVLWQGVLHPRIQARRMEGSTRQWQRLASQEPCPLAGLQLSSCTSLGGSETLKGIPYCM